jgi:hypothetical protein
MMHDSVTVLAITESSSMWLLELKRNLHRVQLESDGKRRDSDNLAVLEHDKAQGDMYLGHEDSSLPNFTPTSR